MEDLITLIRGNVINQVQLYITNISRGNVYNADKKWFILEIHSGRALAPSKSQKTVEGIVESLHSTTNSYTILRAISADGCLFSPLFLVVKESTLTVLE